MARPLAGRCLLTRSCTLMRKRASELSDSVQHDGYHYYLAGPACERVEYPDGRGKSALERTYAGR